MKPELVAENKKIGTVEVNDGTIEDKPAENAINKYLKEQGIEAPPVRLHIFYNGHSFSKDLDGLEKILHNFDIILPEFSGWSAETVDAFKEISTGEKTPGEMEEFLLKNFGEVNLYLI